MRIVQGLESYQPESIAAVVALGAFDGIHLGHRAILGTAVTQARREKLRPLACMFDRHPMEVLQPEKAPLLGACTVIPQEYLTLRCRSIDLRTPAGGSWQGERAVDWLLAELAKTDHPMSCPHGRPVVLRYSVKDIQKAFKRI